MNDKMNEFIQSEKTFCNSVNENKMPMYQADRVSHVTV